MGRELTLGELEVLSREENRVRCDVALGLGQLDEGLDRVQQGGGTTGLQDHLVGVDEEGRLRKHVRIKMGIGGRADDRAVDLVQDGALPSLGKDAAQAIGVGSVRAEANLDFLLGALESGVRKAIFVGHRNWGRIRAIARVSEQEREGIEG